MRFLIRLPLLLSAVLCAHAATPSSETMAHAARSFLAKQPVTNLETGFTLEEGYRAQQAYVHALVGKLGGPVGHKIGLITKEGQERMGASGPIRGTLLKKMLLKNRARLFSDNGFRPMLEMDMAITVLDDRINDATTVEGIVQHVDELVCFIELVDVLVPHNEPMDAAKLAALNVGARQGIRGEARKMTRGLATSLPSMKVSLVDREGTTLAEIPRLGFQPLEALLWLVNDLKKEGKRLRKGDFVSLGSTATAMAIPGGKTVTLRYDNLLDGPLSATVKFVNR